MDVFEEKIKKKLIPLTYEKKLLFAVLICEKLYPNYVYFQNRCSWGDSNVLLKACEMMYQSMFKSNLFDDEEINHYIDAVDAVTPDTEDYFLDSSVSLALDACTAIHSALKFMLDREIDHIIDTTIYARDTIYMSIVNRDKLDMNLKGMDNRVSNDPVMVREVTRQFFIIEELEKLKDGKISDELIQQLKDGAPIINIETLK